MSLKSIRSDWQSETCEIDQKGGGDAKPVKLPSLFWREVPRLKQENQPRKEETLDETLFMKMTEDALCIRCTIPT